MEGQGNDTLPPEKPQRGGPSLSLPPPKCKMCKQSKRKTEKCSLKWFPLWPPSPPEGIETSLAFLLPHGLLHIRNRMKWVPLAQSSRAVLLTAASAPTVYQVNWSGVSLSQVWFKAGTAPSFSVDYVAHIYNFYKYFSMYRE